VERLEGSAVAKDRLRALLEALTGRQTAGQACLQLGLGERRFRELRDAMLQAALAGLEPQSVGRPPQAGGAADARVVELEAQVRELKLDLRAAQVREEIALVLPQVLHRRGPGKGARRGKGRGRKPAGKSGGSAGSAPAGRRGSYLGSVGGAAPPDSGRPGTESGRSGHGPSPLAAGPPARACHWLRPRPGWDFRPGPWSAGKRAGARTGSERQRGAGQRTVPSGTCAAGRWH
jgi:hypothetical protein